MPLRQNGISVVGAFGLYVGQGFNRTVTDEMH